MLHLLGIGYSPVETRELTRYVPRGFRVGIELEETVGLEDTVVDSRRQLKSRRQLGSNCVGEYLQRPLQRLLR
jgi:hypothetical protein